MTLTAAQRTLVSPRSPAHTPLVGVSRLEYASAHERLNHQVFRYPAKFHPPVARALIERFSKRGETVLDPFCGSGTTLVEGLAAGRSVVGTDVDPLAILVSSAKIRRYDVAKFDEATRHVRTRALAMRAADLALWGEFTCDISQSQYDAAYEPLERHVPALPRIEHWFRRRVVLQLAALRSLAASQYDGQIRALVELCFASIIRNASNADPVPVSGLEVTSHMRRKEAAGRAIDPYTLFAIALDKTVAATRAFEAARAQNSSGRAVIADARRLSVRGTGPIDCVVTSPPYLTAVDYYRRHTLEMFWLGLTTTAAERREIMPRYIGRDRMSLGGMEPERDPYPRVIADAWLARLPSIRPDRARAFHHYCSGLHEVFASLDGIVRASGSVVVVVGDVRFCGLPVKMSELVQQIASPNLALVERLWYPLANRYMSYSRKHEADINVDQVLVFRRAR